jgi:epoxyqueuosine reductase
MNEKKLLKNLFKTIEKNGYSASIVSAKHIPELKNDIKKHYEKNLLYAPLYESYKTNFEIKDNIEFKNLNSLISITKPVPQFEVKLYWKGKEYSILIPPTYLYGREIIDKTKELIEIVLSSEGYNVAYAIVPQKTLAVRSGLAKYGRNNITYIPEMGSFHRLMAFYSDIPVINDNWQELEMMDMCKTCSACTRKCPTGAIPTDRFLLRAEKCLTYHTEQPGNIPFPEWIDPSWHNCLVGCLYCQKVCPANKKVKDWIESGPIFNEEETMLLLKEENINNFPEELNKKLIKYDLMEYVEVFPRNLKVLLKE